MNFPVRGGSNRRLISGFKISKITKDSYLSDYVVKCRGMCDGQLQKEKKYTADNNTGDDPAGQYMYKRIQKTVA